MKKNKEVKNTGKWYKLDLEKLNKVYKLVPMACRYRSGEECENKDLCIYQKDGKCVCVRR